MTKTYDPDVFQDPEELVPWMEATAAEHQRRRFEEEPFGATIVSMEEFREMIAAGYFDRVPAEPGLIALAVHRKCQSCVSPSRGAQSLRPSEPILTVIGGSEAEAASLRVPSQRLRSRGAHEVVA
jgi:LDH2 family malate/lactate/ureidoglycolate dehydrogenase